MTSKSLHIAGGPAGLTAMSCYQTQKVPPLGLEDLESSKGTPN